MNGKRVENHNGGRGFQHTQGTASQHGLYQTAETLTHRRQRLRLNTVPVSHWTTARFFAMAAPIGSRRMSQGLRVLVLIQDVMEGICEHYRRQDVGEQPLKFLDPLAQYANRIC